MEPDWAALIAATEADEVAWDIGTPCNGRTANVIWGTFAVQVNMDYWDGEMHFSALGWSDYPRDRKPLQTQPPDCEALALAAYRNGLRRPGEFARLRRCIELETVSPWVAERFSEAERREGLAMLDAAERGTAQ